VRVIFQTPVIPARAKNHVTGEFDEGTAQFTAFVYDPGEQVPISPSGMPRGKLMSEWRSHLRPGQPISMSELKEMYIGLPRIVMPLELTDALPDDARLGMNWAFASKGIKL
jgi:hypothetical protein